MNKAALLILGMGVAFIFIMFAETAKAEFESDVIKTSDGDVTITFIGHGSLMFEFGGRIIQVDPFGQVADYAQFSKSDLILLTHEHPDHLDPKALSHICGDDTTVVLTENCARQLKGGPLKFTAIIMKNGESRTVDGMKIEAVAAYNVVHKRPDGQPFHPKGIGNGYILTFGDKRVYIAGDTENISEMKTLGDIDCAFLPMNLPYTMTPEMVNDAARVIQPKILYPYHYGNSDTSTLVNLLKDREDIEVRIRNLQ